MRLAYLSLAVIFVVGAAGAMDHDIHQMQARLAAQEARLAEQSSKMAEQDARMADLSAKLLGGGARGEGNAEGLISLQKNAVITIGGLVNTRYQYTDAKIDSVFGHSQPLDPADPDSEWGNPNEGQYRRRASSKTGSLEIADAELHINVDINEHVDAFLNINLHNGGEDDFYSAESYYVRWKDICNTGFGLKVGRDALVFGEEGFGELDSYAATNGSGLGDLDEDFLNYAGFNLGSAVGGAIPIHNGWDVSGVTQITPYWEGLDGKLSLELSLFQNVYDDRPYAHNTPDTIYTRIHNDGVMKYRSRNFGVGSLSARVGWSPIEDLKFTLSFANYRSRRPASTEIAPDEHDTVHARNNTVYGLAANWRPSFFNRLYLWGQWIHGNNVYFHRDMTSDVLNFGAAFDLAEGLTVFAQGDYLRTKYDAGALDQKATAWAFYTGLQYSLPYGVSLEAGWRHERVKWKDHGQRTAKIRANTFYAQCGLEF